ncbi:hypothetical protein L3Q82_017990, partial [Scortum barcoo]
MLDLMWLECVSSSCKTKALMLWTGPPCSPDLNPIEHLWDIMSHSIHQRHVAPQTVQELADALVQLCGDLASNGGSQTEEGKGITVEKERGGGGGGRREEKYEK